MAKKETAFGSGIGYQALKAEGTRIGRCGDQESTKEWVQKLLSDEPVTVQRASAVCHAISDETPEIFQPHISELITSIEKDVHDAAPRFAFRVLSMIRIPEEMLGETVDVAFKRLSSPLQPAAIHVFAMTVISNAIDIYPELGNELELLLREGLPIGSAGYRNRAGKIARKHGLDLGN